MPWSNGTYTRGYASWSNDAAQNLPISAAKFDTEDNDFAAGINNTLAKDGTNNPSGTVTWGLTNAQILALTRGSDGTVFSYARTGGANNPQVQFQVTDATGATINLTTAQTLALAIQGANALSIASTKAVTLAAPTGGATSLTVNPGSDIAGILVNGIAGQRGGIDLVGAANQAFSLFQDSTGAARLFNRANTTLDLSTNGLQRMLIAAGGAITINAPASSTSLTVTGPGTAAALQLLGAANGLTALIDSTAANGVFFTMTVSSTPIIDFGSRKQTVNLGTASDGGLMVRGNNNWSLGTNGVERILVSGSGNITLSAPAAANPTLTVNTFAGSGYAIQMNMGTGTVGAWQATGSNSAVYFSMIDGQAGNRNYVVGVGRNVVGTFAIDDLTGGSSPFQIVGSSSSAVVKINGGVMQTATSAALSSAIPQLPAIYGSVKTAVTSRSSTTTPANDPDLVLTGLVTGNYEVECFILFDGTTTGTQGISANVNYSGTFTGAASPLVMWQNINGTSAFQSGLPSNISSLVSNTFVTVGTIGATAGSNSFWFRGTLEATASGTLGFSWSQNSSSANATNVRPGSWLKATRIS